MALIFQDRKAHERITRLEQAFVTMTQQFQNVSAHGARLMATMEEIGRQHDTNARRWAAMFARLEAERCALLAGLTGNADPRVVFERERAQFQAEHPEAFDAEQWREPWWLETAP